MRIKCIHEGRTTVHEFSQTDILIGRANPTAPPDLDLSPDDTVSRSQARLWIEEGRCWIEDLNTKYGTFVNGVLIDYRRRLNPGDVICVGETDLRVEVPEAPAAAPEPAVARPEEQVQSAINAEDFPVSAIALSKTNSRERLALLLELPLLFGALTRVEDLLQLVLQRTLQVIRGAERGTVLLERDGALAPVAHLPSEFAAFSTTLAQRAVREGRGFIWRKLVDGIPSQTVRDLNMKTGMYVPLVWQGKIYGVLCVDNPRRDSVFTEDDLRLLFTVGQYAAMALANQARRGQ
jgi:sigma-B regulation protein RsbU (phosphoserine phosphatase)